MGGPKAVREPAVGGGDAHTPHRAPNPVIRRASVCPSGHCSLLWPWFLQQDWGAGCPISRPLQPCPVGTHRPWQSQLPRLCFLSLHSEFGSQQEILEEVVRELHKVKEEIIDGECRACPGTSPRVPGEWQAARRTKAARQQSGSGPDRRWWPEDPMLFRSPPDNHITPILWSSRLRLS